MRENQAGFELVVEEFLSQELPKCLGGEIHVAEPVLLRKRDGLIAKTKLWNSSYVIVRLAQ